MRPSGQESEPQDGSVTDTQHMPDEEHCAICHRVLWSDGLPPAQDGNAWICGDCDQARNFETLDLGE